MSYVVVYYWAKTLATAEVFLVEANDSTNAKRKAARASKPKKRMGIIAYRADRAKGVWQIT